MSGPKRGGTHPIFGLYVGGDALTTDYALAFPGSYPSTSQPCSEKGLQVAENFLHLQKNNTTSLKFDGKLDVTKENSASLSEFNMEGFLRSVADLVEHFGLETFSISWTSTGR